MCRQVKEMFPVGKKLRPAMRRVLRPVQCCDGNRLASGSRYAVDRFVDIRCEEDRVPRPCSSSPVGCGSQGRGRATRDVQTLELLVRKKADRSSIRRPERKLGALRTRQRFCCCAVHGTQEQHLLPFCNSCENKIAAVSGDGRGSCLVPKCKQGYIGW